jgi:hypothetical protein
VRALARVPCAGAIQQAEVLIDEVEDLAPKRPRYLRRARAVLGVKVLVQSPAIVQHCKELNDFDHGTRLFGQAKPVLEHPGPVHDTMNAVPGQRVLREDGVHDGGQVQRHGDCVPHDLIAFDSYGILDPVPRQYKDMTGSVQQMDLCCTTGVWIMSQAQPMEQIEFVERELEGYRGYVKDWRRDHTEVARRCWPVEDVIAKANFVFGSLSRISADLKRHSAHDLAAEVCVRQQHVMRQWLALSVTVLEHVAALEKTDGAVEGAPQFRADMTLARSETKSAKAVEIDDDGNVYEMTGEPAILPGLTPDQVARGIRDAKAGRTRSLSEIIAARASN